MPEVSFMTIVKVKVKSLSHVRQFATPWTVAPETAMAPHTSTLAWKIPWTEQPGRLQSMGLLKVRHDWVTSFSLFTFHALEKEMATHSSAWRIPGTGEPGGLPFMVSHRVGHDWSDLAAAAAEPYNMFLSFFFIGFSPLAFVVAVQLPSHVWLFVMP